MPEYECFLILRSRGKNGGGQACLIKKVHLDSDLLRRRFCDSELLFVGEANASAKGTGSLTRRTMMLGWYVPPKNSSAVAVAERHGAWNEFRAVMAVIQDQSWDELPDVVLCGDSNGRVADTSDDKGFFDEPHDL